MKRIKSSMGLVRWFKWWRLSLQFFPEGTRHPNKPDVRWGFKIVEIDMATANGFKCKTKRWWVYTRKPALCINYEPK